MRRFLIPLLAVFALPTEINAEDYPHHLDMKNKDRNFLVRTCTSDKKSIDDKKKAFFNYVDKNYSAKNEKD